MAEHNPYSRTEGDHLQNKTRNSLSSPALVSLESESHDGTEQIEDDVETNSLEETIAMLDSLLITEDDSFDQDKVAMQKSLTASNSSESSTSLSPWRPKSFLHDEMSEFNQIFKELVSSPKKKVGFQTFPTYNKNVRNSKIFTENCPRSESLHEDFEKIFDVGIFDTFDKQHHVDKNTDSCGLSKTIVEPQEECWNRASRSKSDGALAQARVTDGLPDVIMKRHSCIEVLKSGLFGSIKSSLQCLKINDQIKKDESDSAYQTGDSATLTSSAISESHLLTSINRVNLQERLEKFNSNSHGLVMHQSQRNSDVFQGFIRVYMNLKHPISMKLSARPISIYDLVSVDNNTHSDLTPLEGEKVHETSFYLPTGTSKIIHITSETSTQSVIKILLNKFNITDNLKKFALYENFYSNSNSTDESCEDEAKRTLKPSFMRRLGNDEKPLEICLHWTENGTDALDKFQFVLQEYSSGEILWEEFSLPELNNFLSILDREEEMHLKEIKDKFSSMKREMLYRQKKMNNN